MTTSIHFLGTGSAFPSRERENTSMLITAENNKSFLIDVSGSPSKSIKNCGGKLCELDALLLTHTHIDHIYGLPSLLWGMWLEERTKPFYIYVNEREKIKVNEWLNTIDVKTWGIKFTIEVVGFDGQTKPEIFRDERTTITAFPAKHAVPTFGYALDIAGKKIVYAADTEVNPAINDFKHIDYLIHEATFARKKAAYHTSMEEVLTKYALDHIGHIIFVHVTDDEPYDKVIAAFRGQNVLTVAKDMLEIKI